MAWLALDNNAQTVDITASETSVLQRHDDGSIWLYTGTPLTGWLEIDSNPATVQVVAAESSTRTPQGETTTLSVYQRHRDGRIFWTSLVLGAVPASVPHWTLLDDNRATVEISAAGGALFQRHDDGSIWVYTGTPLTGWDRISNGPATSIVATEHALFKLGGDRISRYTGTPMVWDDLDANPATAGIAAHGVTAYQLHRGGRIFGHLRFWQLLDANPATAAIAVAHRVYQRHTGGGIWAFTGDLGMHTTSWDQLDHNPMTVQIAAGGPHLYQRHRNGSVWQFTG